mgnify:CR=1 FL=1|tara:strand:+ start:177 stop:947 length:771 start_codon:yes stop_codon:yes gene_type:complete
MKEQVPQYIRLQKHMAQLGYCSRRKAEEYIAAGKVRVNGKKITAAGTKVDPKKDQVTIVGQEKRSHQKNDACIYVALNKPIDYICSAVETQGASVLTLITPNHYLYQKEKDTAKTILESKRIYPVGRLDKDSEGLVLLTNDGAITQTLTHPSHEHEKEYEITINQPLTKDAIRVLERGMMIDTGFVQGIVVKKTFNKGRKTIVTVILKEGKNRQIRKMFGRLGYNLHQLKRIRIGKLKLNTLPTGSWKFVEKKDII